MEEKKSQNVSSGAEKTEKIVKKTSSAPKKKTQTKQKTVVKKTQKPSVKEGETKKIALDKKKAKRREERLIKRAEKKQKAMEKRMRAKEEMLARRAERKKRQTEARAERIARRELLRNESAADKKRRLEREKKERNAVRAQKRERAEKQREERLQKRKEAQNRRRSAKKERSRREGRDRGFAGWLAAVVSLGAVCLALTTVVTAGYFRMNEMTLSAQNGMRETIYEMTSASESMDDSLNKLRASGGAGEQRRLLTDVLVESALLESAFEKLPVSGEAGTGISAFFNRINGYARMLLAKVSAGKPLSQEERTRLEEIYQMNASFHATLNNLARDLNEEVMTEFMSGENGALFNAFDSLTQEVKPKWEERAHEMQSALSSLEEISATQAEEVVKEALSSYHIKEVRYTGEVTANAMQCYNFVIMDEGDRELFAQVTKKGGKLCLFDSHAPCEQKNFDVATATAVAEEFLQKQGYSDLECVWASDAGFTADLTFVSVQDGVRAYPDLVRVRVCLERGIVVGMDASDYLVNHKTRAFGGTMPEAEARALVSRAVQVDGMHLALIPVRGEERLAYEYDCTYGEQKYIVYLDALSGEELEVLLVHESEWGSSLR